MTGRTRSALCFTLFLVATAHTLFGQNKQDSPVFKGYRPPTPTSIIKPSDLTYQLLEEFSLTRKANAGDALAQHELGLRYLMGQGVKADTAKGAYWIQKAASQNLPNARFNMGILTFNGWGVLWNPFETYKHFLFCAQRDIPDAAYIIGQFFTENLVVQQDWNEAYRWVKKAAEAGYDPAKDALAEMGKRGYAEQTSGQQSNTQSKPPQQASQPTLGFVFLDAPDDTSAASSDIALLKDAVREAGPELRQALGLSKSSEDWLEFDAASMEMIRKAADVGSPEALGILARSHEKGIVVKRDPILAVLYYVRAIRMNSPRAPGLLKRLVQEQQFFPMLKARTEANDPDAQCAWATLKALRFDAYFPLDQGFLTDTQALEMLQKAASKNHVQATIELGLCYYSGRWVQEDREKAVEYWKRVVELGSREAEIRIDAVTVQERNTVTQMDQTIGELEKATQEGSVLAQVALAYCYETGTGVARNLGKAARLYRSSAQRGSQDAYFALRRMHDRIRPQEKEFQLTE